MYARSLIIKMHSFLARILFLVCSLLQTSAFCADVARDLSGRYWGIWPPSQGFVRVEFSRDSTQGYAGRVILDERDPNRASTLSFECTLGERKKWILRWIDKSGKSQRSDPLQEIDTVLGSALAGNYRGKDENGRDFLRVIFIYLEQTDEPLPNYMPATEIPTVQLTDAFHFKKWTSSDNLVSNSVRAIAQTHDGYLWVGTTEGLSRFDGETFTSYMLETEPSLKGDSIRSLMVDRDGRLFVGTKGSGLFVSDGGRFVSASIDERISELTIDSLIQGSDGAIWFLVDAGERLVRLDSNQQIDIWNTSEVSPVSSNHSGNKFTSIVPGEGSSVFLGTYIGAGMFDGDSEAFSYGFFNGEITSVLNRPDKGPLLRIGSTVLQFVSDDFRIDQALKIPHSAGVYVDRRGDSWCVTARGVFRFDGSVLWKYSGVGELFESDLDHAFEDLEGNIWITSSGDGLGRLRHHPIEFLDLGEDLLNSQSQAIAVHPDGSASFAALNGIVKWQAGETSSQSFDGEFLRRHPEINRVNLLDVVFVYESIAQDPMDPETLYCGVGFQGHDDSGRIESLHGVSIPLVIRIRNGNAEFFGHEDFPLSIRDGSSIDVRRSGEVWYATDQGVFVVEEEAVVHWHNGSQVPPFDASCVFVDSSDHVWIGSYDQGVYVVNSGERYEFVRATEQLSSPEVRCFLQDTDGTVWIGGGDGITRYRDGHYDTYKFVETFLEGPILGLVEDNLENIWIGNSKGLYVYTRADLHRLVDGGSVELNPVRFNASDGMLNESVLSWYHPVSGKLADGRLVFSAQGGVAFVDPDAALSSVRGPMISIDQIARPGSFTIEVESNDLLYVPNSLPAEAQDVIEISFSSQSFAYPERIRFQGRIPQLREEWTDYGSQRSFLLPGLAPGSYEFQLRGLSHNNVLSEDIVVASFSIATYFYQDPWFQGTIISVLIGFLLGLHRWRIGYQRHISQLEGQLALNSERSRIARDLHDELGAGLARIRLMSDEECQQSDNAQRLKRIRQIAAEYAGRLREVLWSLNSDGASFDDLGDYLHTFVHDFFSGAGISVRITVGGEGGDAQLSPKVRRTLLLCTKGIASNVLIHSEAKRFTLAIIARRNSVICQYHDDGCGFDPAAVPGSSFGILALRERVESAGGSLILKSKAGDGTDITIEIPTQSLS